MHGHVSPTCTLKLFSEYSLCDCVCIGDVRLEQHVERPTSCAPLRFESPPEMQRCRVAHNLPTRCMVPTSAHNLPRLSPVGTKPDAHRIGSRGAPLGPRSLSSRTPDMYPHGMPDIPNGGGTSPRISPSPLAGLLMAPLSVSSRGGSRPLNRWGQAVEYTLTLRTKHC